MINCLELQILRYKTLRAYRFGVWKEISVVDNGERLVQVPSKMCFPYYARQMKLVDSEEIYLRESVLERFLKARGWVRKESDLDLMVYDGWRSVELQENLFWFYLQKFTAVSFKLAQFKDLRSSQDIKEAFYDLPDDLRNAVDKANRTYVSWPSKSYNAPSPHATGGAIDVWLHRDGESVNMGVPFDWMEKNAGAFYHLKLLRKSFGRNDLRVSTNRSLLLLAMSRHGFSCYGPEFWHYNYGNQMDALVKGLKIARYSYIEP